MKIDYAKLHDLKEVYEYIEESAKDRPEKIRVQSVSFSNTHGVYKVALKAEGPARDDFFIVSIWFDTSDGELRAEWAQK